MRTPRSSRRFTPAQRARMAAFVPHPTEHRRPVEPDPCPEDAGRVVRMRLLAGRLVAAEIRARDAENRVTDLQRVRLIGIRHERDQHGEADRGTQGEAMIRRGAQVETIEDDVEREDGTREFQRSTVARIRDGVLDHYARAGILVGRRLEAMEKFSGLYAAAGIMPGTQRSGGPRGYGQMSEDQADAWADWCRASDHVSRRCRETVEDVARGRFPCRLNAVDELHQGAADLADHFGMSADRHPSAGTPTGT